MEAPSLPDESKEVEVTQSSIKNEIELCDVEGNPQSSSKVDAPPVCHGYSRSSLASTSSRTVCILISCGIVVAHALLLWGQIDPQWSVYVYDKIDVDIAASNKTEDLIGGFVDETSKSFDHNLQKEIIALTYFDIIKELWKLDSSGAKFASFILFTTGAIWPHCMLLLLHFYFYAPTPSKSRRSALYWMGSLAKLGLTTLSGACVVTILFNQNVGVNEQDLANSATLLMTNVVPFVWNQVMDPPPGILSDATASLLNTTDFSIYDLSDIIFQNEDPQIYPKLLNTGCTKFYTDGLSCEGTEFYQPNEIRGGIVGVMTKCLMIRGDKCQQCQCIANNALYNHAVPEKITSKIGDYMSTVFATLLESVQTGDIDFKKWFDINANALVGIGFDMYPSLIGFLIGVAISMIMVLWVNSIDHQNSIKKYQHAVPSDDETTIHRRSLLFSVNDETQPQSKIRIGVLLLLGIGIVPFVFFAIYIDMFQLMLGRINRFANIEFGRDFQYSMIDLVVGIKDGTEYKAEFTYLYAILLLAAPMLRATLLAALALVPMTRKWHVRLGIWSDKTGGIISWEPFFLCVAGLLIAIEFDQEIGTYFSIGISFDLMPTFAVLLAAWLVLTGFNAYAWKTILKRYDPFLTGAEGDKGGPYCACDREACCCFCLTCSKDPHSESNVEIDSPKKDQLG